MVEELKGLRKVYTYGRIWNDVWIMPVYWRVTVRVVQLIVPAQGLSTTSIWIFLAEDFTFRCPDKRSWDRCPDIGERNTHPRNRSATADTHQHFRPRTFTRAVAFSIEWHDLHKRTIRGVIWEANEVAFLELVSNDLATDLYCAERGGGMTFSIYMKLLVSQSFITVDNGKTPLKESK